MNFDDGSNFQYNILKLLRKLSWENIFLLYSTFIMLLEKFIQVLTASSSFAGGKFQNETSLNINATKFCRHFNAK